MYEAASSVCSTQQNTSAHLRGRSHQVLSDKQKLRNNTQDVEVYSKRQEEASRQQETAVSLTPTISTLPPGAVCKLPVSVQLSSALEYIATHTRKGVDLACEMVIPQVVV